MKMVVSSSKHWTEYSYPYTPELLPATATGKGNKKAHRGGRFWGKRNKFDFEAENDSGMLSNLTEIGNNRR